MTSALLSFIFCVITLSRFPLFFSIRLRLFFTFLHFIYFHLKSQIILWILMNVQHYVILRSFPDADPLIRVESPQLLPTPSFLVSFFFLCFNAITVICTLLAKFCRQRWHHHHSPYIYIYMWRSKKKLLQKKTPARGMECPTSSLWVRGVSHRATNERLLRLERQATDINHLPLAIMISRELSCFQR